ncbi:MAG: integral rane sensor signal transduction histidine kinase [Verrucomicrobiales bacterium]|nr:integral rane sensor signal transduction histidine kinase [Verrucomicrobiales bacterium]
MLRNVPIKRKLTLAMMLTGGSVLLLTSLAFMTYGVINARRNLIQNLNILAEITAANASAALLFEEPKTANEILSKLEAEPSVLKAALYTRDRKVLAHYPQSMFETNFPAVEIGEISRFRSGVAEIFYPVHENDRWVGTIYVQSDLSALYDRFRLYAVIVVAVMVTAIMIIVFLSNWLQRQISGPILALADTARAVSEQRDYSVRGKVIGTDELGALTQAFNHMLNQIQERETALRASQSDLQELNRELEQRVLSRTAELAATNKELEAFTYSVSHDLRAPLRHVDAFAQLAEEEAGGVSPEMRKYVERIRIGVQNMGRLIDDLLNLSRVGRADLVQQPVSLNRLVDEVISELQSEIGARKIEWIIGRLPTAVCDPGLMKQVFANLIANSVKYTRPRPEAVICIDMETVEGEPAIFVRDNGVGFDSNYSAKLFGVFQRLHRAEDFEGTGVGLAIVKRILDLHGGRIWAASELDKSATFWFTFHGLVPE